MPMYQAEALWLSFTTKYPYALKVGTGLVNAITGEGWAGGLPRTPQGYLVLPEQPWLDGYCVEKGVIRQFVAARLGDGYTAEEQLNATSRGGLQLEAFPLKPAILFEKQLKDSLPKSVADLLRDYLSDTQTGRYAYCLGEASGPGMGLGAGGKMKQEIYEDPWESQDWDLTQPSRVWIHLCDAVHWFHITGELPPQKPIRAKDYARYGFPWFDYYRDDLAALEGGTALGKLKSIFALGKKKGDMTIPQEESVTPGPILALGPHAPGNQVPEWDGQ